MKSNNKANRKTLNINLLSFTWASYSILIEILNKFKLENTKNEVDK